MYILPQKMSQNPGLGCYSVFHILLSGYVIALPPWKGQYFGLCTSEVVNLLIKLLTHLIDILVTYTNIKKFIIS